MPGLRSVVAIVPLLACPLVSKAGGHDITIVNANVAGLAFHYKTFKQITNDIDDARVYGGIHFRFDQDAGSKMGREVATFVVKHNLRPIHPDQD